MFQDVFDPDPVHVGVMGIGPAILTTFGAVFFNAALSWFKGRNRELLTVATVLMSKYHVLATKSFQLTTFSCLWWLSCSDHS
jgi:hypothetical protein